MTNPTAPVTPKAPGFLDSVRDEVDKLDNSLDQIAPLLEFIPLMKNLVGAADAIRAAIDKIDPKT